MARKVFPDDRTAFVYGTPGSAILTPNAAQFQIYADAGATSHADIQTLLGVAIPNSVITTGPDTLLPEFKGPNTGVTKLWLRNYQNGFPVGAIYEILSSLDDRITAIEQNGGSGGPVSYIHNQGSPSATWTVAHNLGFHPNITVVDSGNSIIEGDITYPDSNNAVITFSASFSGVAYCS